jgi:CheY-specific phosphatase CheX
MSNLIKDVLNGIAFIIGIVGFMFGEFIISSALLAGTTVASNVNNNSKKEVELNQL